MKTAAEVAAIVGPVLGIIALFWALRAVLG